MSVNAANNQIANSPSAITIDDADFLQFQNFANENAAHQDWGVQLAQGKEWRLIKADRESNVFARTFNLTESAHTARAANNDVRTQFLKSVLRVCGVSRFDQLDETIRAQFSGTQEHYTGEGTDMALDERGEATSGRPLSVRRITCIVNATKAYIETKNSLIRDFGARLEGEDQEDPSLPAFDLDTQGTPRIWNNLRNVVNYFKNLARHDHQYNDDMMYQTLYNPLYLLFGAVRSSLKGSPVDKDNAVDGIVRRFKKAALETLEALNANEATRVCSDEVVRWLRESFESPEES